MSAGNGLPDRAQVVIVGGGVIGCSTAYHLARRGISDVVLLEQGTLTCGTTWHAAGLVTQLRSTYSLTQLATYSARLFEQLEEETGQSPGYRTQGSITVADNAERWEEVLRGASMGTMVGVETRILDLDELKECWPLIRTDDLVGALLVVRDGQLSPVDVTMALAKGARGRGVTFREGVTVTGLGTRDGRITGVQTDRGDIETETVVLATGMWTRQLAATIGVNVPLQACEHFYVVTEPLEGVDVNTPVLRDPGNYTYFKEETGKIMAGFFEPRGKIWHLDGVPPGSSFVQLPEDWEHVGPIFERSIHRVPALGECGIQLFFNGPESFTPDGVFYMGEAPEVDGCFVAAGFNSIGVQTAGGVGWVLADWIVDRNPPLDLTSVDISRALPFQADPAYLRDRIGESLGLLYAMHWPHRQYESARNRRLSPLHDRLDAAGAVFGETAGWERPNWYAFDGQERAYEYSYGKQNWWANAGAECRCRAGAGGPVRPDLVRQVRRHGPRCLHCAQPAERRRGGRRDGSRRVHAVVQRPGRHRGRPDRHAARRGLVPRGHRRSVADTRLGAAAPRLPRLRRDHPRTSPNSRRCWDSWARAPGMCWRRSPVPRWRTRTSPSPRRAASTWPAGRCWRSG